MKVLIVDDEALARRRLSRMLDRIDGASTVGEAVDGIDALEQIRALSPDVVLLDIRMPGLDGMTLARSGASLPPIIFITAYDEYAVQAFEACAVDYLLKPVEQPRLEAALAKVSGDAATSTADWDSLIERLRATPAPTTESPRITARRGDTVHVFDSRDIPRFHAEKKYTIFVHEGREYLSDESLAALESRLAEAGFFRCHRSELVALSRVRALRSVDGQHLAEMDDGQRAPVSRRQLGELRSRLGIA